MAAGLLPGLDNGAGEAPVSTGADLLPELISDNGQEAAVRSWRPTGCPGFGRRNGAEPAPAPARDREPDPEAGIHE